MYIYVRAQEKVHSVRQMCFALSVTECGYYKWKRNRLRPKAWQILLAEMHIILREHPDNENYGVERMMIALKHNGIRRSYSTVKRARQKGNLLHESRRSPDGLTKADKKAERPENLIKQDFSASEPNEKWLTDIAQVPCSDATLYIAPVLDCYRGEIVSLSMDTNMKKELCIKAIDEAAARRKPGAGVIVHSDAGRQSVH